MVKERIMRTTAKKVIALICVLVTCVALIFGAAACGETAGASVTLDKDEITLETGGSYTLIAETSPTGAKIEWTTDNDKVATVENGKVTAVGVGVTVITAKIDGASAKCKVTVNKKTAEDDPLAEFGLNDTPARIDINTNDGNPIPGEGRNQPYVACSVSVDGYGSGTDFDNIAAEVRIRGNNTAEYEKKPYRLKFGSKRNLLGLNDGAECKNWVLLACYKDVTFLRDALAFEVGEMTLAKDGYYVSDYSYAELYINGEYNGFYMVAEQQQVNPNRVDISEPELNYEGTDIGYLVEYDGNAYMETPDVKFDVDYSAYPMTLENGSSKIPSQYPFTRPVYYTIKNDMYGADAMNRPQYLFAKKYTENVFDILYKAMVKGEYCKFDENYDVVPSELTDSRAVVESVVNLDSWVDMFVVQEFCRDNDVDWSSFFLSFDMSATGNKKLTFQAPWDFDNGFGMKMGFEDATGFACANSNTTMGGLNPWLALGYQSDWFMKLAAEKWESLIADGLAERANKLIDTVTEEYESYFAKNYETWDNLNECMDPIMNPAIVSQFKTHADAAEYLKGWVNKRIAWLNGAFAEYL